MVYSPFRIPHCKIIKVQRENIYRIKQKYPTDGAKNTEPSKEYSLPSVSKLPKKSMAVCSSENLKGVESCVMPCSAADFPAIDSINIPRRELKRATIGLKSCQK